MNELFLKIFNMSISASWLILAVVIFRLILKKAPKCIYVILWGIVAVKLICPFSIKSAFSLIPSAETIPINIEMDFKPAIDSGIPVINSVVNPVINQTFAPAKGGSVNHLQILISIFAFIWIIGIVLYDDDRLGGNASVVSTDFTATDGSGNTISVWYDNQESSSVKVTLYKYGWFGMKDVVLEFYVAGNDDERKEYIASKASRYYVNISANDGGNVTGHLQVNQIYT